MAFTAAELANIANAALDYYWKRPEYYDQAIQNKPLVQIMESRRETFPGGKGDISVAVQGEYGNTGNFGTNDFLQGYTHNDTVGFYNPANILRAQWPWREHHIGLSITGTELKIDGLSVTSETGIQTSKHSKREMTVLVNLLENKLNDQAEQVARSLDNLFWGDGTADAKGMAGIQSLVTENPVAGTVGGIDRSAKAWWQNRAITTAYVASGGPITSSPANGGVLISKLQEEYRQLIRYGGKPTHFLVGSDFLGALETEMRANGYYSDTGFARGGDVSVGEISFKGTPIRYAPWLDDDSKSKFGYWLDLKNIKCQAMQGEWRHAHQPARPHDAYVYYSSLTYTGQVVAKQLNSSGVYEIA